MRAILRGLGYEGRVKSPTYALLEPYSVSIKGTTLYVYHFDLYRLASPQEWLELGFRDYLDTGALCLIEWPEQVGSLLGPPDCQLTLALDAKEHLPEAFLANPLVQPQSNDANSIYISEYISERATAENTPEQNALFAPTGRWIKAQAFSPIGQRYLETSLHEHRFFE